MPKKQIETEAYKKSDVDNMTRTLRPSLPPEVGRFKERLAETIGKSSMRGFSAQLSVSEGTLRSYLRGDTYPDLPVIAEIASAGSVRIQWLATGDGPKFLGDETPGAIGEPAAGEYAYLPLYNVRAAAGHGAVVETEEVVDSLAFKKEWIHNELHANPADLYLLYVHGDSMEPALRAGEVILVNRRASAVQHDGIYVLVMDGTLLVKRLQSLPGGRIRISSDNPAYQPFEMEKTWLHPERQNDAEGAGIIGRVVWAGRRM